MRQNKLALTFFICASITIIACKKNVTPVPPVDTIKFVTGTGVYIIGFGSSAKNDYGIAKCWKDGIAEPLQYVSGISDTASRITGIAFSGDDVYLVGWIITPPTLNAVNGIYIPVMWKNGIMTEFTNQEDKNYSFLYYPHNNAIATEGNDIYLALNTGEDSTVFMKNGNLLSSANPQLGYLGNSIFVSGSDIYLGGVNAFYCKNGNIIYCNTPKNFLGNDGIGLYGAKFTVSGNDVYIPGNAYKSVDDEGQADVVYAFYWKNGEPVELKDSISNKYSNSTSSAIAVLGRDIYVAGVVQDSVGYKSNTVIWKNGVVFTSIANSGNWYYGPQMTTSGDNLYLITNVNASISLWKNGQQSSTILPDIIGSSIMATGIAVNLVE